MKTNYLVLLTCLLLGFSACNDYKADYDALVAENATAQKRLNELEEEDRLIRGEYTSAIETLNSIEDTLRAISFREKEIQSLTQQKEFGGDLPQRQKILAKIQALRDANEEAKNEAKKMQSRVSRYQIENQQLKKMIAQAETRIIEKEEELEEARAIIGDMEVALAKMEGQLTEKSGQLSNAVSDLKKKNDQLSSTNDRLQETLEDLSTKNEFIDQQARAYVACGDKKALRKVGILSKISMKKLTKNYQQQVRENGDLIDYFNNDQIDCGGDGEIIYVLPDRDPSSYEVQGGVLNIKDPKKFWATDKTVVLVKK
jgi:chromosome segregation ATPase